MSLRVLIGYSIMSTHVQTTFDYLNAFHQYSEHDIQYIHATNGAITNFLLDDFDVIITNYCLRHCFDGHVSPVFMEQLRSFRGLKIAIVQDEYNRTDVLKDALLSLGFHVVLTCVPQRYLEYVYPRNRFAHIRLETVLTGYVPDHLVESEFETPPLRQRPITIGYRGREIGAIYGQLGHDKFEIGRRMRMVCGERGISHDIATDDASRIYGPAWFSFIKSCRSMLGSESGSNVFDFDSSLERRVVEMTRSLGRAPTFEEFEPFISTKEKEIDMGQVSPRVFECAACRTPMVLFEGRYSGAIFPDEHYIPLKKDFSNIDDVLLRLDNIEELSEMASRAYRHLVESGEFGYRAYVGRVDKIITDESARLLACREPPKKATSSVLSGGARADLSEQPTDAPLLISSYYMKLYAHTLNSHKDEIARLEASRAATVPAYYDAIHLFESEPYCFDEKLKDLSLELRVAIERLEFLFDSDVVEVRSDEVNNIVGCDSIYLSELVVKYENTIAQIYRAFEYVSDMYNKSEYRYRYLYYTNLFNTAVQEVKQQIDSFPGLLDSFDAAKHIFIGSLGETLSKEERAALDEFQGRIEQGRILLRSATNKMNLLQSADMRDLEHLANTSDAMARIRGEFYTLYADLQKLYRKIELSVKAASGRVGS